MKRLRWWRKPRKPSDEVDPGRYFGALRKHEPLDSFPAVQDWITTVSQDADASSQHDKLPLSPMKVFINTYSMRLAVTSFVLAITFVSCTTPVEQEETIGYMVSGIIEAAHAQAATHQLGNLEWIRADQLELGVVAFDKSKIEDEASKTEREIPLDHRFVIALPETGETQAHAWAEDLRKIEGIQKIHVAPLHVTAEVPVYKAVIKSIWAQNGNMEFKPDPEQLHRAIADHLETLELHGVEVKKIKDKNGHVILSLSAPEEISVTGLTTLKQFIAQASPQGGGDTRPADEIRRDLLKKIAEIEARIAQTDAGPAKEKLETYKKQLEQKAEAIQKNDDR